MLLKSVVQAIPILPMSVFRLPTILCQKLERMMVAFCWLYNMESSEVIWMIQNRMVKARSKGGMGFKVLFDFNLAILDKQGQRFMKYFHSLVSKFQRARYSPNIDFLHVKIETNLSYSWHSLIEGQNLMHKGCRQRIEIRENICIW